MSYSRCLLLHIKKNRAAAEQTAFLEVLSIKKPVNKCQAQELSKVRKVQLSAQRATIRSSLASKQTLHQATSALATNSKLSTRVVFQRPAKTDMATLLVKVFHVFIAGGCCLVCANG